MPGKRATFAAIGLALALVLAAACGDDGDDQGSGSEPGTKALNPGENLGSIERFPGGTAVRDDLRTIAVIACADGVLSIETDREEVLADMPCDRIANRAFVDRFIGLATAISVLDGGKLRLTNDFAGSLEFPTANPRTRNLDAAP